MEWLPPEVAENIASYLTTQELAASCAVSKSWREFFNQDIIWRHRCQSILVKPLKTEECRVTPKFVSPEKEGSLLSPVGEWRMNFMRQNHLWNNYRTGNGVEEQIPDGMGSVRESYFVTNSLVLLIYENTTKLLDVSGSPFLKEGEPFKMVHGFTDLFNFERFGKNKCVITHGNVTMVYNIGSPVQSVWELCHVFIANEEEKTDLSKAEEYAKTFVKGIGDCDPDMAVIGNKLVACPTNHEIHIWDMDRPLKLKEDSFLANKYVTERRIKRAENQLPYCIVATFGRGDFYSTLNYYVYSLDILNFLPFNVQFNVFARTCSSCHTFQWNMEVFVDDACIVNEVVAILNGNYLRIYRYKTSELLVKIVSRCFPRVLDSQIFFLHRNRIKAFNATSELLEILPPLKGNKGVQCIEVICNKFLLFWKKNSSEQVVEVHKVNDKACNKLSKLTLLHSLNEINDLGVGLTKGGEFNFPIRVNESCSRVITNINDNDIHIVSFW